MSHRRARRATEDARACKGTASNIGAKRDRILASWGNVAAATSSRSCAYEVFRETARRLVRRRTEAARQSASVYSGIALPSAKKDSSPNRDSSLDPLDGTHWDCAGSGMYVVAGRQVEAFDRVTRAWKAVSRSRDIRVAPHPYIMVGSFETTCQGTRKFVATTGDRLWKKMISLSPTSRHMYEIIQEGCASHLYFDIEYKTEHNPDLNGAAATSLLIREALALLGIAYGLRVSRKHVVELDSSRPGKFSRHVVVRLPTGAMFRDNAHVGEFVLLLLRWLQSRRDAAISKWNEALAEHGNSSSTSGIPDGIKDLELVSLWVSEPSNEPASQGIQFQPTSS